VTHTALVKAGVPGDLIVGEGMSHCYLYDVALPEARDAYDIITRFFDAQLGAERE
jgi:acetyl esterase/lipase